MVAFKNSTGIKANSSFCTFRFPIAEAHQLTKPFQYQPITTTSPTQPFAHFVFMPILVMLMCLVHSAMEKAIFLRIKMTPFSFFFAFFKKNSCGY